MLYQRTVKAIAGGEGVGLHSGRDARFQILPAPPDTGVVFVREDVNPHVEIPARVDHVCQTRLATSLGDGHTFRIATSDLHQKPACNLCTKAKRDANKAAKAAAAKAEKEAKVAA